MINAPTHAVSAEVTAIDQRARGPLLLLTGSALLWLVVSGILALIASIQLHSPQFLADSSVFTHGRTQAMRETSFIYGWAANAGLAVGLWVLGRLGGSPLRGLNWAVVGSIFWNLGVLGGLIGIATGSMTSFSMLQLPRAVQPLMVVAHAAIGIAGVLAWTGRRTDGTYASQWYAVAALFLFPWMLTAAQMTLLWWPVRGTLQAVASTWYMQGVWTFWLAPLALAGAYYVLPKVAGRVVKHYEFAPMAFWTLLLVGAWLGGRHLIGGPVPAWVPTMAAVAGVVVLMHYFIVALNMRIAFCGTGNALSFLRVGIVAYLLTGVLEAVTSFRSVALETQFTLLQPALDQLAYSAGLSLLFFGAIYYMVPRLTGTPWASAALTVGHRVLLIAGIVVSILALGAAGWIQGGQLLDAKKSFADIAASIRTPLLIATGAQLMILGANLLVLVNFLQTAAAARKTAVAPTPFRQPASTLEAIAS